jgi:hypothetical protein
MRKALIITGLAAAALFGGVACSGTASADDGSDQTVVINQSNSQSAGSVDCAPASLLAQFPWLPVPACQ